MKDWKQEIAEIIRARCDHEPGSMIVGAGCSDCQGLYMDILWTMDQALDGLIQDTQNDQCPTGLIERFKRSIPRG